MLVPVTRWSSVPIVCLDGHCTKLVGAADRLVLMMMSGDLLKELQVALDGSPPHQTVEQTLTWLLAQLAESRARYPKVLV